MKQDRYFPELLKTLGFGAAFASIPIFASMRNIQPPWPEPVAYISAAIILVGALVARELSDQATRRTRVRLLLLAAGLTVFGLFAYLYLYSTLVVTLENGDRRIIGYACNETAQAQYRDICPHLTEMELAQGEYKPDNFYPRASITAAQLSLVAAWLLFTAGLVAAVGWAVAARKDETPDPPAFTGNAAP